MSILPNEIITKIFGYLKDHELLAAGQTCKIWQSISKEAVLWRRRTFDFHGDYRQYNRRVQMYLDLHGDKLRHLTLVCPEWPTLLTAPSVAQCVKTLMTRRPKLSLREFNLCCLHFCNTWDHFKSSKHMLINSIKQLLQQQDNLRCINLNCNWITLLSATKIMNGFMKSKSIQTVEQLDIVDFYEMHSRKLSQIGKQIDWLTSRCSNLREIAVNYNIVYTISLEKLCQNLRGSLHKICLFISYLEDDAISSKDWILAKKLIPNLKVVLCVSPWCHDCLPFLTKTIPLTEFRFNGYRRGNAFCSRFVTVLNHLGKSLGTSLKSIHLTVEGSFVKDDLEPELLQLLSRCSQLDRLVINKNLINSQRFYSHKDVMNQMDRGLQITSVDGHLEFFSCGIYASPILFG